MAEANVNLKLRPRQFDLVIRDPSRTTTTHIRNCGTIQ